MLLFLTVIYPSGTRPLLLPCIIVSVVQKIFVGRFVGQIVGLVVGAVVGLAVGSAEGNLLGDDEGAAVIGGSDGVWLGTSVGFCVGAILVF